MLHQRRDGETNGIAVRIASEMEQLDAELIEPDQFKRARWAIHAQHAQDGQIVAKGGLDDDGILGSESIRNGVGDAVAHGLRIGIFQERERRARERLGGAAGHKSQKQYRRRDPWPAHAASRLARFAQR